MATRVPNILVREFNQMEWVEPRQVLVDLRWLELNLPADMDERIRRLRTNPLKEWHEARFAALFAYGISNAVLHLPTRFSKTEKRDFDAVMKWQKNGEDHYSPLQIKELPPDDINPDVSLNDILDKLGKYSGEDNLTVVVCLNRKTRIKFQTWDRQSKPRISELWYLGCTDVYQSKWFLYGNVLANNPRRFDFEYPEGTPNISQEGIDQ
jgi:hypothetical protein